MSTTILWHISLQLVTQLVRGKLVRIFLHKSKAADYLCHFALKPLSRSNYAIICGGIFEFLLEIWGSDWTQRQQSGKFISHSSNNFGHGAVSTVFPAVAVAWSSCCFEHTTCWQRSSHCKLNKPSSKSSGEKQTNLSERIREWLNHKFWCFLWNKKPHWRSTISEDSDGSFSLYIKNNVKVSKHAHCVNHEVQTSKEIVGIKY